MLDHPPKGAPITPPALDHFEGLARRLREAEHLDPEARSEVANLLRQLAVALDEPRPSPQAEDLARSTSRFVQAVHDQHDPGLIEAARDRLEKAVARAEAKAPVATDVVLQLIGVLSGLGI